MRPEPDFARSLAAFGNAALRGEAPFDAFDRYVHGSAWVNSLVFAEGERRWPSAASWLSALRAAHPGPLRLRWVPRMPGSEQLVLQGEANLSLWEQRWDRREGAKAPPWFDISWTGGRPPAAPLPAEPPVAEVLARLIATLEGLVQLGRKTDLGGWEDTFAGALALARGEAAPSGPGPLPPSAPPEAQRLAAAGNASDVFGGMGSWNDFGPLPDPTLDAECARLSGELLRLVDEALLATAR